MPPSPLEDDGGADITEYNAELEKLGNPKWFHVPWLFSECYLYRRMHTYFTQTKNWKSYDVFHAQKESTFRSSQAAVVELATRYRQIVGAIGSSGAEEEEEEKAKLLFMEMSEICLWGNATDLSLLTSLSYEDIQKLQGSEARKNSEKNILVNDLPAVFDTLRKGQKEGKTERRVDIVLDNAGFELYVDLILAGYLIETGLATEVVFHPKDMPWFVSDVLPADFANLLQYLKEPEAFFAPKGDAEDSKEASTPLTSEQADDLKALFNSWGTLHADGKLILRPNQFWTKGGSYWRLPAERELYEDLKSSELVIFKGDLNYRKLTGDAAWDPTTSFVEAIGPLGGNSGLRVLALRTCKADVVVGLLPGKDEELREDGEVSRKWAWSGKWAVVQFWDGKQ
jgi:uncharacterized protein with ATP-grasp and redox domains